MKLYENVTLQSVATQYIGKPDYVITDGWREDYINVNYDNKSWCRISDFFGLSDDDKKTIQEYIFKTHTN